ncbi:uncharacterized protein N7484_007812 [Penicillium longicatenatum]|uniref:uncharacterized protein n=1 Tax=Penicillium longicatenatum TaxID=1561947 RepID=UPI002549505C|nr:uncharacterized protein N7484_007812 [Penicillium longicatenatum]KAJ5639950.1 hypothetical protein N7484_007812 [Penicillium longicatenatum]
MKGSYVGTLLLAFLGTTLAKERASCADTRVCMPVTHDMLPMQDMTSPFGQCLVTCVEDEKVCCSQSCAPPLACRTNFANCHLKCRDHEIPPRFQCLDNCIMIVNNCKAEAVIEPQVLEHNEHCNKDFHSCQRTCRHV